MRLLPLALALLLATACQQSAPAAPVLPHRVVKRYAHDPNAFTQGLVFHEGALYESTGQYGQSSLRKVELATGKIQQIRLLPSDVFGEGLALVGDRLFQLTWREQLALVYKLDNLETETSIRYEGEGWGLAYDGKRLIKSDGSDVLKFLDPTTFRELGRLRVTHEGQPVTALNELEMVGDSLYANVWQTDRIARISLADGRVTGWLNLSGLLSPRDVPARGPAPDVLNGIAYDPGTRRLYVTGKYWPLLFELQLDDL